MASSSSFHVDQRIIVPSKGPGTIAFIGKTEFADGEWIGVVLDEPKGKNNGSVQKKDGTTVKYFSCNDNHGLYIRPTQIESIINDSPTDIVRSESNTSIKSQPSSTGSTPSLSEATLQTKPSGLPSKSGIRAPVSQSPSRATGITRSIPSSHNISASVSNERKSPPKKDVKPPQTQPQPQPTPVAQPKLPTPIVKEVPSPPAAVSSTSLNESTNIHPKSTSDSQESQQLIVTLKSKITDQEEQIQTLIKKRRDDLEKIKEFERTKLQLDQLQTYKREAQERIKELNDKLQQKENEFKEIQEKYNTYRDEMNDTEVRIESLTLDLEMAEEKLEIMTLENTTLKEKLEEVQLELDVIKGEIQLNGTAQVANGIQKKIDDERTVKMEQALIKLRDLSLAKQAENDTLKKQCETFEHKVKVLTKENENAKADITTMQTTIADLKEQVDTCLGAQQMVDILTNKNLSLEDQVRELQETADNLESLYEVDKEMEEHAKELEHELRENIDLLQNRINEKDKQIEQLHYTIGDHERTILKFRETVKNMQFQTEQSKKQIEKYDEQLKLVGSAQSSEFKAKIVETKTYGEIVDGELRKLDVQNLSQHVQFLTLFLPEQFIKRGADHDCVLVILLIRRLISKCDLLINEIQKKAQRIDQISFDDVVKTHRAEEWSFVCKICQTLSIFRMILRKYVEAMEICKPDSLRHLASSYHELLAHEKSIDFLIDLLQKDQLQNAISLNALDKTITFYEHIYKSHLDESTFSMSNYMRDLISVVLLSSDALQTDIQRIQLLQKPGNEQSPFGNLIKRLVENNEQMRSQANKINRLVPQEDNTNRLIILDSNTISSIELTIRNLDRLAKTFHEICSNLTTQILILSDPHERINTQDIESIAYQACDKVYKKEDSGPYESLWNSMHETVLTLTTIGNALETGLFDSNQNEKSKQTIYLIAEQLKTLINESEIIRARLELKDEELLDLRKNLKIKHDELSQLNIRLSLNEKKIEILQKESDEQINKQKQILEENRIDSEKKLKQCEDAFSALQKDYDQLEQENSSLTERLKQITKTKLVDDLLKKKTNLTQRTSGFTNENELSSSLNNEGSVGSTILEQEISSLRKTIRLLKDELWQIKMNQTSKELSKLSLPTKEQKSNEIVEIYKNSNLLLNDLFSTIANYKITGENVSVKQDLIKSKMKLIDQTTFNLKNRLDQCQNEFIPGSTIETEIKTFSNPKFSKSISKDRQLAAEIRLSTSNIGGEFDLTYDQYRKIIQQAIGCV